MRTLAEDLPPFSKQLSKQLTVSTLFLFPGKMAVIVGVFLPTCLHKRNDYPYECPGLIAPRSVALALPKTPVRVIGIDLGTTNSALAEILWSPDAKEVSLARCLEVEQPTTTGPYIHVLVPSVVAIHANNVLVGEGAKRLRANTSLRRNKDIFYECKNDIGTRRTYHMAPEGFRSAAEIGGKVLAFLKAAAQESNSIPPTRTVVTVPASFQIAQRRDYAPRG